MEGQIIFTFLSDRTHHVFPIVHVADDNIVDFGAQIQMPDDLEAFPEDGTLYYSSNVDTAVTAFALRSIKNDVLSAAHCIA